MLMEERLSRIHYAADFLASALKGRRPVVGIVLGSGLGKLGENISDSFVIPYKDIPGFPISTAVGHKGNFIVGTLGGKTVIAMQGRFHYYEGYPMELVTLPIRVMRLLGVHTLLVSNAAGGANPEFEVGDLMVIRDHINMMPNPLIGPNMDEFGTRFPDMTCVYDKELSAKAEEIASSMGITLRKGVYFASTGPTYETPAEIRFFAKVGADALGMSTVPEVIVARHCGMRVFGMSVITNKANFDNDSLVFNDGADVVLAADAAAGRMSMVFEKLIESL